MNFFGLFKKVCKDFKGEEVVLPLPKTRIRTYSTLEHVKEIDPYDIFNEPVKLMHNFECRPSLQARLD